MQFGLENIWFAKTGFPVEVAPDRWTATPERCEISLSRKALVVTSSRGNPRIRFSGVMIAAKFCNALRLRYRASGAISNHCYLFYRKTQQRFHTDQRWELPVLQADGAWHTLELSSRSIYLPWTWGTDGEIEDLWLELECSGDAELELAELKFGFDCRHPVKMKKIIAQFADPQIGFGEYNADLAHFRRAIDLVNAGDFQAVILCGDLMNVPSPESFRVFRKELDRINVPYFLVPGNHDIPRPELRAQYQASFGQTFYTAELPFDGYRLIALDTNLWMEPVRGETERMDAFLETELARAKAEKKAVIIAGHSPIFVNDENEPEAYYNLPVKVRKRLKALFRKYPVKAYLAGHTHTAFTMFWHKVLLSNAETTGVSFDHAGFGFRRLVLEDKLIRLSTIPLEA